MKFFERQNDITHQVNTSNTVVAEYSYDAWGRRRDKDDWSYTLSSEPDLLAGRSFISHEYLPWFKLVISSKSYSKPESISFVYTVNDVEMKGGDTKFYMDKNAFEVFNDKEKSLQGKRFLVIYDTNNYNQA